MNDSLKAIQKMVEVVKTDEEVSLEYMKIFEREEMLVEEGIEQGIEQGIKQGIIIGKEQEKVRAEQEKARADKLQRELDELKKQMV